MVRLKKEKHCSMDLNKHLVPGTCVAGTSTIKGKYTLGSDKSNVTVRDRRSKDIAC